ncbi:MAG: hypothetical protein J6A40_03500 [Bacteroides sp.]|nr:hypothetical protein [Bacteroides sp.]
MEKEDFQTIEKAINKHFKLSRKSDEYFPIYIIAKDNALKKYIFDIDYSAEILDLKNAIKPFDGNLPSDIIGINTESLFVEIKLKILDLIKDEDRSKECSL